MKPICAYIFCLILLISPMQAKDLLCVTDAAPVPTIGDRIVQTYILAIANKLAQEQPQEPWHIILNEEIGNTQALQDTGFDSIRATYDQENKKIIISGTIRTSQRRFLNPQDNSAEHQQRKLKHIVLCAYKAVRDNCYFWQVFRSVALDAHTDVSCTYDISYLLCERYNYTIKCETETTCENILRIKEQLLD